jgi:DNA-binding response OmpR family regulator
LGDADSALSRWCASNRRSLTNLGMTPKVLIVDDEKNIGESLTAIFTSRGYESKTAFSAELAVEIIAGCEPDLAIVDVGLPKMNGIDLAIALKNGRPSCRVLLFSFALYNRS